MHLIPDSLKAVWPFAWADTVREQDRQLNNAARMLTNLARSHADLMQIAITAARLVDGPTDAPSRGEAIGALNEALLHYRRQGHFENS